MKVYKIHFIRHGLTQGNLESRYMGMTDCDLCEQGVNEVIELTEKYEYPNVGRVYTSPLKRCKQTAKLIYPFMDTVTVDDLREYHFGDFEGKTFEELSDNVQYTKWMQSGLKLSPPNGEKSEDFVKRVMDGLMFVINDMLKSKLTHVAVVTHGGVLMNILSTVGIPKRSPAQWGVGNGKGYTLIFDAAMWDNFGVMEVFEAIPEGADPTVTVGNKLFSGFDAVDAENGEV